MFLGNGFQISNNGSWFVGTLSIFDILQNPRWPLVKQTCFEMTTSFWFQGKLINISHKYWFWSMVLRFEIFVPATSTFEINRNGLISNNLLNIEDRRKLLLKHGFRLWNDYFCKVYQIWWLAMFSEIYYFHRFV